MNPNICNGLEQTVWALKGFERNKMGETLVDVSFTKKTAVCDAVNRHTKVTKNLTYHLLKPNRTSEISTTSGF